jgi:Clr5 domain
MRIIAVEDKTRMSYNMSALDGTPTADDWEARRAQITRLYRDEGKPLREVMLIVNKSRFRATYARLYLIFPLQTI